MAGILYVVATPIGNWEDLTFRAARVLREVRWIACEDPNATAPLLTQYEISTPLTSYHDANKEEKAAALIAILQEGQDIALVSDAGTPVIFDPGAFLVAEAIASGVRVAPIPGASAPMAAASVSGVRTDALIIDGALPVRRLARERYFSALRAEARTVVLLCQEEELCRTLETLGKVMGRRRIALAGNLTRPDEECARGTASELLAQIRRRPIHGDVTIVIEGRRRRRTGRLRDSRPLIRRVSE